MAVSHEESDERLEDYLTLIFLFNIPVDTCVPYLNKLLTCKWHHQHGKYCYTVEMAAYAHSTNFLYREAGAKLEYLSFDRSFSRWRQMHMGIGRGLPERRYDGKKEAGAAHQVHKQRNQTECWRESTEDQSLVLEMGVWRDGEIVSETHVEKTHQKFFVRETTRGHKKELYDRANRELV